ncbi:MAG: hypothetical protein KBS34_00860 [Phascolarctobacterium sp.]|nr:hypothetical protein [Candidatus Phascolarctobacterium equi]
MAEIQLNEEVIAALQGCKDAKEVVALAKSKGIELTEEKAGKLLALMQNDKLSDEDLGKVVGGGCSDNNTKKVADIIVGWFS